MKKTIILLSGKKGVGKDTFANILISKLNHNIAKRIAFADVPKELCGNILNVDVSYFHDRNIKDSKIPNMDLTYREFLISFAEGVRKKFGSDFWAKMCLEKETNVEGIEYYVVSDMRLLEEWSQAIDFCLENNYNLISIRVENKNINSDSNHITETSLDNHKGWNYIIDNSSTVEDLMKMGDDVVKEIVK